jgi:hypothetical protein
MFVHEFDVGVRTNDSPGQRFIIVHSYMKNEFIAGTLLMLKTKSKSRNYGDEINFEKF